MNVPEGVAADGSSPQDADDEYAHKRPGLSCRRLSKAFGGSKVVADLTVDFPLSRVTAIIGPNGAGKTTLLNMISGFVRPDAGEITFRGRNITRLAPHEIARLGISRMFQELRIIHRVSVIENVVLAAEEPKSERLLPALLCPARDHERQRYEQAREILNDVGLSEEAGAPAGALSYGQRKLLTLACCIATQPRLFLLDEPFAGLHPDAVHHIAGVLRRLTLETRTIVFVEHDLAAVRQLAEYLVVMDNGRVIADGVPEEVLVREEILRAYVA